METSRKALELGIAEVKDGARLGDIGAAIQEYVEAQKGAAWSAISSGTVSGASSMSRRK